MRNDEKVKIVDVNTDNVEKTGFFCFMSKRKTEGFQRKLNWLKARFAEGMRIKMLELPERGFIEFIPGEYAWRAVNASGFMFIHCLWVVGKSKGKGYAGILLNECIHEAKQAKMKGVAMVTSEKVWLIGKKLLIKHDFESVEQVGPFNLMVLKFDNSPAPTFTGNFEQKASRYGEGLMVISSAQCPYIPDATSLIFNFAKDRKIPVQAIELTSCQDVRDRAPSPYGVFNIVYNGQLLAYHYLLPKDLNKIFA